MTVNRNVCVFGARLGDIVPAPYPPDDCYKELNNLGFKKRFFDDVNKAKNASSKRRDLLLTSGCLLEEYIAELWPLLDSIDRAKVIYNQQLSVQFINNIFPGTSKDEQEGIFRKQYQTPEYIFDRLWRNDVVDKNLEDIIDTASFEAVHANQNAMRNRKEFILQEFIVPDSYIMCIWDNNDGLMNHNRQLICRYQPLHPSTVEALWLGLKSRGNVLKKLLLQHQKFGVDFYQEIVGEAMELNELGEL